MSDSSFHWEPWVRYWQGFEDELASRLREAHASLTQQGVQFESDRVEFRRATTPVDHRPADGEELTARFSWDVHKLLVTGELRTGNETSELALGFVPLLSRKGTFIAGGAEHALLGQLSVSPGVTLHRSDDEDASPFARLRTRDGRIVKVELLKTDDDARLEFGPVDVRWSALKELLGGAPALDSKKLRRIGRVLGISGRELAIGDEAFMQRVRERLSGLDLGAIGQRQLERRCKRFGVPLPQSSTLAAGAADSAIALLKAFADEPSADVDDDWDLGNLRVRRVGDFLEHAMGEWLRAVQVRILAAWRASDGRPISFGRAFLAANGDIPAVTLFTEVYGRNTIGLPICQWIAPQSCNALAQPALARRLTFNGPGGIKIGHKRDPRAFHWSHYGRLCPYDTPSSVDVGVTLSLAAGARINEDGFIEAPCHPVVDGKVTDDRVHWLSPWQESDSPENWIAFPDERLALERGEPTYAHRSRDLPAKRPAAEVRYVHVSEEAVLSVAAGLVPFRPHNDAVRVNMACNFLRQALPLASGEAPGVVSGSDERALRDDVVATFFGEAARHFGANLIVGYLPWKGWNFEDALVVSESAAQRLTSLHFEQLPPVRLSRSLVAQKIVFLDVEQGDVALEENLSRFDDQGVLKEGVHFRPGDAYVLEPSRKIRGEGQVALVRYCGGDADAGEATVHKVITLDDTEGRGWVCVIVRRDRIAKVGDKLANRHGHKGVISLIVPDAKMPYVLTGSGVSICACGETRAHVHFEILINPISVISRKNLGQLHETVAARPAKWQSTAEKLSCFDPGASPRELESAVLAGSQYVMKLDQNAADKRHARAVELGRYSAFVQQPLAGRKNKGGQRLGEMEVWALQAHDVPNLLQEMLTLKSDNPRARRELVNLIEEGKQRPDVQPEVPEAVRAFTAFCYGLGLDLVGKADTDQMFDPALDRFLPDGIKALSVRPLGKNLQDAFLISVSKGEVTTPIRSGRDEDPPLRWHREGLESESIFGPARNYSCACGKYVRARSSGIKECELCGTPVLSRVARRRRMGHIDLSRPVPNMLALMSTAIDVSFGKGDNVEVVFADGLAERNVVVVLRGVLAQRLEVFIRRPRHYDPDYIAAKANAFARAAAAASDAFREALGRRLGIVLRAPRKAAEAQGPMAEQLRALQRQGEAEARDAVECADVGVILTEHVGRICDTSNKTKLADAYADVLNQALWEADVCPADFVVDLLRTDAKLEQLVLDMLPVIPPDLRREVRIPTNGRTLTRPNDLTVLYQRLLNAEAQLEEVRDDTSSTAYPDLRREQVCAVARLMCNQLLPYSVRAWDHDTRQQRKSLSSMLAGKQGLLIGHMLGKRVDFSARAVIVPDPGLNIDQCKLPFAMAVELYRPLLLGMLHRQKREGVIGLIDRAKSGDSEAEGAVRGYLNSLMADYPVVLNRQPTLHRLGMLAFRPLVGDGDVIALPPLVTSGFNADFDGDQMAAFLPLTEKARDDAKKLFPSLHLWHPRDGRLTLNLSQDIAMGLWLGGNSRSAYSTDLAQRKNDPAQLADEIGDRSRDAFGRVTAYGLSFGIGDLEAVATAVARQVGSSEKDGPDAKAKRAIEASDLPLNTVLQILRAKARGDSETLLNLAGQLFEERDGSNLTQGLLLAERLRLAVDGRDDVVETKLATAEGGYLTKQLVSLAQHVVVTAEECGADAGVEIGSALPRDGAERWLLGRVLAQDCDRIGKKKGDVLGATECETVKGWVEQGVPFALSIRSPALCRAITGVCRSCYGAAPWGGLGGRELAADDQVPIGTTIGLIAAQAVSEPLTQSALRRKHGGAHAGRDASRQAFDELRGLLKSPCGPTELTQLLKDLDADLVKLEAQLSMIHVETLLRGSTNRGIVGWISALAEPGVALESRLARAALEGCRDDLTNPRSQSALGARVHGTVAEEQP